MIRKEIAIENNQAEKTYTYIIGKPKKDFELSNNSNSGTFSANNNSNERITNFCSCLFFMVLKIHNLYKQM